MPHSTIESEDHTTQSDVEEDVHSDVDLEEERRIWLTARYDRDSANPMKKTLTAPWDLPISEADVEKLKGGFRPRNMDDKYAWMVEDPDESGNISVHIIRFLLQEPCFILHIVPKASSNDGGSAKIHSITWEGNRVGWQAHEQQAKIEAVILSRNQLACEFEALPHYPSSLIWQSSGYTRLSEA